MSPRVHPENPTTPVDAIFGIATRSLAPFGASNFVHAAPSGLRVVRHDGEFLLTARLRRHIPLG